MMIGLSRVVACAVCLVLVGASNAQVAEPVGEDGRDARAVKGFVVEVDPAGLGRAVAQGQAMVLEDFPLTNARSVDLSLERFTVTTDRTRFVIGSVDGADRPFDFDPSSIIMLRGTVVGEVGSHVFLAFSDDLSTGTITLPSTGERFGIASRGTDGRRLAPGRVSVFALPAAAGGLGDVPLCGVADSPFDWPAADTRGTTGIERIKQIEMAIETDWDLAVVFDSPEDEAAYVTILYAAMSDIYLRDAKTRLVLNFVRLWDTPNDMFNGSNPLGELAAYWFENMGQVERDVVQMLSGRRDIPWGGVAFGNGLCDPEHGYSFAGYTIGSFADPSTPSVFTRDIVIPAHELGHNAGAPHTHGAGIDTCDNGQTTPQRGTIMSYCGQTFSGGDANTDMRFHSVIVGLMRNGALTNACIANDDNGNGIDDAVDIADGTSSDVNGNGIPDEAEDCNGNGVLDDTDIANGTSLDLDGNGVPDECQPDCNNNDIPDTLDISSGADTDDNGNFVPDACEPDCDDNGISDYAQIQADMTLDLDRNAILDDCQDCDNDGITDLDELAGAGDVWMASLEGSGLRRYLSVTGTFSVASDDAAIDQGRDVLVTPDGRVLVTSRLDSRVAAFDFGGGFLGDLVASGVGGLSEPGAMVLMTDGTLLVASAGTDSVLRYDSISGAYLGAFVAAGDGGLVRPFGVAFGPGSDLYVTSDDGRVLRYDGATGAFINEFVTIADNGGMTTPRTLMFLPSGDLLVASQSTDEVLQYDGVTGAFIEEFTKIGSESNPLLEEPWGIRMGPDGLVYISRARGNPQDPGGDNHLHLTNARIYIFDPGNGYMIRSYVQGVDSGLEFATGFDFLPTTGVDCNRNLVPDACDIASGTSLDDNGNGVPDECEEGGEVCIADFAEPFGVLDFFDVSAFLAAFSAQEATADLNSDGMFDFFDLQVFLGAFAAGCP
jgi:Metallo-peptidase family M12